MERAHKVHVMGAFPEPLGASLTSKDEVLHFDIPKLASSQLVIDEPRGCIYIQRQGHLQKPNPGVKRGHVCTQEKGSPGRRGWTRFLGRHPANTNGEDGEGHRGE